MNGEIKIAAASVRYHGATIEMEGVPSGYFSWDARGRGQACGGSYPSNEFSTRPDLIEGTARRVTRSFTCGITSSEWAAQNSAELERLVAGGIRRIFLGEPQADLFGASE